MSSTIDQLIDLARSSKKTGSRKPTHDNAVKSSSSQQKQYKPKKEFIHTKTTTTDEKKRYAYASKTVTVPEPKPAKREESQPASKNNIIIVPKDSDINKYSKYFNRMTDETRNSDQFSESILQLIFQEMDLVDKVMETQKPSLDFSWNSYVVSDIMVKQMQNEQSKLEEQLKMIELGDPETVEEVTELVKGASDILFVELIYGVPNSATSGADMLSIVTYVDIITESNNQAKRKQYLRYRKEI